MNRCIFLVAVLFLTVTTSAQNPPSGAGTGAAIGAQTGTSTTPASEVSKPSPLNVREEIIGEITPGAKMEFARSTKDHLAWVEKRDGKRVVKLDGKQVGATYDDANFLKFSDDEQHLAFIAKRNSKWVLVIDGEERTKDYGRLNSPSLSENAKFFAVTGCREKKCHLNVNGEEMSAEFEDISAASFTSNGEHYGYFGKRNKKWIFLLDGKETGPEMDDFYYWKITPDAKHVAVAGMLNKNWTWIVDGTPGPSCDVISTIGFSPDYQHYAWGGTDSKWGFGKQKTHGILVVDGKVTAEYQGSGFLGGWTGLFGQYTKMVTGLRSLSPNFHGLSDPRYTKDGRLVYAGRRGDKDLAVIVDGTAGPSFEDIVSPISISGDGKHIAYLGKRGDSFVEVRDQSPGVSFPGKRTESFVGQIMIDHEGDHLAYEIVRGGLEFQQGNTKRALRQVIIDGQAGPEYDALGISDLELRAEAKRHHYTVIGAEGSHDRVVFNGRESKLYDNVFNGSVEFVDDQTIEFVAQNDQKFLRVTGSLE